MCSIFNYAKWSRLEFGDVVIKDHWRWSCTVLWTLIKDTKMNQYRGWVVGWKGVKKKQKNLVRLTLTVRWGWQWVSHLGPDRKQM